MTTASAKQIASSSVLLLAENLIRLLAVAAVSFWIARQLGPGQFGILNFASAFAAILLAMSTLGMDAPVILRLTKNQGTNEVMGAVLVLRLAVSALVFIASVFIALILKHDDATSLTVTIIVCLGIILNAPSVFDYWFKANTLAAPAALARITGTLISAAAKIVCLHFELGVQSLAWTVVLEATVTSTALTIAYYKNANIQPSIKLIQINWDLVRKIAKESIPYMWSAAAIILYMKIDIVMLGYLSSNAETGIYSLAQKLSEVLYVVPVVLIDSAYPILTRKFIKSKNKDTSEGQMLFDVAVGGSFLACFFALLFAGPAIRLVFGNKYSPSIDIFYLHAWSCIAIALNQGRHRWLATLSLQKHAPTVTAIGLLINVAMNLILIPSMGAKGAAIATVVSYFISGYFASFLIVDLREIGLMQSRSLWPWFRLYRSIKQLTGTL